MEHPSSSHRRTVDPPTLQAQASGDLGVCGFHARSWSQHNRNPSWRFSGPLFLLTFNLSLKVSEIHSVVSPSLRPHGLYVHGILQARILELVAFSFSRDLPNPGIEPRSPALQADSLPAEPRLNFLESLVLNFSLTNFPEYLLEPGPELGVDRPNSCLQETPSPVKDIKFTQLWASAGM